MTRLNLFEFNDQYWCPKILRDMITDFLAYFLGKRYNLYKPAVSIIKHILQVTRKRKIIELCAGAGFQGSNLQRELDLMCEKVVITLTDKYPHVIAYKHEKKKNPNLEFLPNSIDATNVPQSLEGIRVIYTAFHHFNPRRAHMVLQDAVDKREAICIFELLRPALGAFIVMLLVPFITLGLAREILRPMNRKQFFLTYVIPAFPFIALWDAVVSMLRSYVPHELKALVKEIRGDSYEWKIGQKGGGLIFLIGYPGASHLGQDHTPEGLGDICP